MSIIARDAYPKKTFEDRLREKAAHLNDETIRIILDEVNDWLMDNSGETSDKLRVEVVSVPLD